MESSNKRIQFKQFKQTTIDSDNDSDNENDSDSVSSFTTSTRSESTKSTKYTKSNLPPWNVTYPVLEYDDTGSVDVEKLLEDMDDTHTEWIDGLTSEVLREQRIEALMQLELPDDELATWLMKLEKYRFVDELQHVQLGRFVRWVPLTNPDKLRLVTGGFVCGIYIEEKGIEIAVLVHRKYVQHFFFDNVLLFQKFTPQEEILLSLVDYLEASDEDEDDDDVDDDDEEHDNSTLTSSKSYIDI